MSGSGTPGPLTEGRVQPPCRYCGTAYMTCVDGDPCCKACLHAGGHDEVRRIAPASTSGSGEPS